MPIIKAEISEKEHKEILEFLNDDSISRWLRQDSIAEAIRISLFKYMDETKNGRR